MFLKREETRHFHLLFYNLEICDAIPTIPWRGLNLYIFFWFIQNFRLFLLKNKFFRSESFSKLSIRKCLFFRVLRGFTNTFWKLGWIKCTLKTTFNKPFKKIIFNLKIFLICCNITSYSFVFILFNIFNKKNFCLKHLKKFSIFL